MRSVRLVLCLSLVLGLAAAPTSLQAQAQALQSVAELLKDGTIQSSTVARGAESVAWGRAVGIVEAPIEQVMAVVESYADYQSFMPHFKTSKVLSQRGSSALVYMQASIAKDTMTLWAQLKVGPGANVGDTRVIRAKMMSGNMNAMEAVWEVTPVDAERTLVSFQLVMDPKLPLPSSFITGQNQKAAAKTIRALRTVVAERAKAARAKP
jgi:ribosome-associated toxin RatA of RatAB toxin-antitoxin module